MKGKVFIEKNWEILCEAKDMGGLGFRDFEKFSQAMMRKQAWQLIEFPNSLVCQVLKSHYFSNISFLQAHLGDYPSYVWRFILWGEILLKLIV